MARVLAERYELRRLLAVGGMAEVYEAHDTRLGRPVAVKILRTDLPDPRARDRFEHEARLAGALHHPNAVPVFDVGEEGARPFIVMELIDGDDLADHLARVGRLSTADAVRVADGVLRALEAAHAAGIVHRDVKPGNVLLGRDGRVRLADFGIAKAMAEATADLTQAGQVIGTPRYLSPEQRRGEPATARSDLYSVGVVLYELLTGAPPLVDDTVVAGAGGRGAAALAPLALRRPDLAPSLAAVVDRAVALEPADRFADAASMRAALVGAAQPTAPWPAAATAAAATPEPTALLAATSVGPAIARAAAPRPAASPPVTPPPVTFGGTRPKGRRHLATVAVCVGLALVVGGLLLVSLSARGADGGTSRTTPAPATTRPAPTPAPTTRPAAATTPATTARPTTTAAPTTTLAPTTTTRATTTTTVARTTTTVARTTTTAAVAEPPSTVDELVAILSRDTASYGDRAATLLGDLRDIQAINPKRKGGADLRAAAAAELDKVSRWRDEGSLDDDVAGWSEAVLRPLAR